MLTLSAENWERNLVLMQNDRTSSTFPSFDVINDLKGLINQSVHACLYTEVFIFISRVNSLVFFGMRPKPEIFCACTFSQQGHHTNEDKVCVKLDIRTVISCICFCQVLNVLQCFYSSLCVFSAWYQSGGSEETWRSSSKSSQGCQLCRSRWDTQTLTHTHLTTEPQHTV